MYFLYILKCCDDSLYTGITINIEKRMEHHKQGKGSKYVRSRLPFQIVYSEEHENKSLALKREISIKKLNKKEKLDLINSSLKLNVFNSSTYT